MTFHEPKKCILGVFVPRILLDVGLDEQKCLEGGEMKLEREELTIQIDEMEIGNTYKNQLTFKLISSKTSSMLLLLLLLLLLLALVVAMLKYFLFCSLFLKGRIACWFWAIQVEISMVNFILELIDVRLR
jgi:hypothetical protein